MTLLLPERFHEPRAGLDARAPLSASITPQLRQAGGAARRAETFGHLAYDANWLARAAGISLERAKALERIGKMQLLVWLRRSICLDAWVEVNAYANLGADANAAYDDDYRRFVGVDLPNGDYFGTRDMFATAPLYVESYLYANMIAAQFRAAMRSAFGVQDLTASRASQPGSLNTSTPMAHLSRGRRRSGTRLASH